MLISRFVIVIVIALTPQATQAALLINLYQEEPLFQLPNRLLTLLLDIDELLVSWRYRHALMVHR